MFKCLQTHYKMQAVVCLNISVSAAFCAAPKNYLTLFKIPKATVLFQQLGRLDLNKKSDRAVRFTSVLRLQHFRNTGRYIRIVTGLVLMQISGLIDQCNISFFCYLCFYGSSLPIAHQGRQVW